MAKLVDTITDFGSYIYSDRYITNVEELDIKDIRTRMLVSRVENNIRSIFNRYGRIIKSEIKSIVPVYTGQFRHAISFQVGPPRRLRPNTRISLRFGIDLKKSQQGDLSEYYKSVLYGKKRSFVSARNTKLVKWALSKNIIYKDNHGVYRWVEPDIITRDKLGRRRRKKRAGRIFEGMSTYLPNLTEELNSVEIMGIVRDMQEDIINTVNEVLHRAGIRQ